MEESTTPVSADDTGVEASTQPVAADDTQAADSHPSESTAAPTEAAAPADDNLTWVQQSKGIDPTTPEGAAKLAEMYRNAETQLRSTRNEAKLQTALDTTTDVPAIDSFAADDPNAALAAQVQALTLKSTVQDFWSANPDAKQYEAKMTEIVTSNPNIGELVKNQYLSLDQLYAMAKGSDPSRETALKQEGGKEALQTVADKQQAKAVTGTASSSAMATSGPTKANVNEWYAGLTPEQRASSETQSTLASLL